ncbi:hypothetical protein LXL04_004149 [Taraxacum kok-saghyz]
MKKLMYKFPLIVNEGQADIWGKSKLIQAEFDLTYSKNDEFDYSSAKSMDANTRSSEIKFSCDYTPSTCDVFGTQFFERSFGYISLTNVPVGPPITSNILQI